ncbi:MAG TPA: asparagine synthase-related protein [Tepidisphaeraceae bacterium]|jgi:hypothetical protein|nr:asparagine synthase-related protein [Tepidisphaeraceae bacterium]
MHANSTQPMTKTRCEYPTSPAEQRTNTFFAFESAPGAFANPFPGTTRLTVAAGDGLAAGIEVVAGPGAKVETFRDATGGCCAYCWGRMAHPDIASKDLLQWIAAAAGGHDISQLRFLVGTFVVLIDDRKNRRVLMVSDIIGIRPWFVGQHQGRLVCGSDVWEIQKAGIDMGGINYDAVASWLRFIWDCSGQSLFKNFAEIGYGSLGRWENGAYVEKKYFTLTGGLNQPTQAELFDGIRQRVSRTFDAVTRDLTQISLPLSGGYDSRFMAALAAKNKRLEVEAFCVRDREAEAIAATMVAEALDLKLRVLETDGTMWNMFAEPYHFTPGGFPITKQVSHLIASQRPGVPLLSGFFGDPTVRGSQDRLHGLNERQTTEELAVAYRRAFIINHRLARFDLIDEKIIARADERILNLLRQRLAVWEYTGHAFLGVTLFFHQRYFMGNNVTQLLHVTDPIIPFASWELIDYKMQNDPSLYDYTMYKNLLADSFPEIAHIPHNCQMGAKNESSPRRSDCTTGWAAAALRAIMHKGNLSLLSRRKTLPRLLGSLAGRRDQEVLALFLYRLLLLENRLRQGGIMFDWNEI